MKLKTITLLASFVMASPSVQAENVNFLSDYSKLTDGADTGFTQVYIAPGAFDKTARLSSVMVDQPEIFIDPDSKYKGIKPADATSVAEALRAALIKGIGENIDVVDEPGESTGLFSWAVTNIYLKKKKRGLLGYTPVGAVAYGVKNQISDVVSKTEAFDVTFEAEATDAKTGEVLFAMTFDLSEEKVEAEWGEALALSEALGRRIGCRMNNTTLAEEQRVDCQAIPIK